MAFVLAPGEIKDYEVDWSEISPDTIDSSTWAVPAGLTVDMRYSQKGLARCTS